MRNLIAIACLMSFAAMLVGCSGTEVPQSPLTKVVNGMGKSGSYTITLADMDVKSNKFTHRYKIYKIAKDSSITISYKRIQVTEDFFLLHEDNFGMELSSRDQSGHVNNLVTPPGFTNIIGQPYYGEWKAFYDTTLYTEYLDSTFWVFNDKHKKLERELGLDGLNVSKSEFVDFQQNYLLNRPYYGNATAPDSTKYGTRSSHWFWHYPYFYDRRRGFSRQYTPSGGGSRGGGGFGK